MSDPPYAAPSAPLERRLRPGASARDVADTVAAVWTDIDAALRPVMGPAGVVALYQRSIYLASTRHGFLARLQDSAREALALPPLADALAQQPADAARAAGHDLIDTLTSLLTSLVGASLTQRLLRDVWDHPTTSVPTQDPS